MVQCTGYLVFALGLFLGNPFLDAPKDDSWAGYRFLLGEWVGEGDGGPGKGSGWCSFALDLQDKVIVRKNHAEYPASGSRPAFAHDDLMVIYRPAKSKPGKASYFDSEGHTIQYTITPSEDGKSLTFLSDDAAPGPRYRLIYTIGDRDTFALKFEIATPGQGSFKTYIEANLRRRQPTTGGQK